MYKILKVKVSSDVDVNGTCSQGDISTNYNDLVDTFGKPSREDQDKVNVEWDILFTIIDEGSDIERKVVATIYDWKLPSAPLGQYHWHIGGYSPESVDLVRQYLYEIITNEGERK
jgi:hypothetical protein|tara:strand:- start:220 stop:564 length:345 start_codon:yes stop_codon:yes gene_type:complete